MTIPHAITLALAEIDHARQKHNWSIENPETSDGKRLDILRDEVNEVALEALTFIPTGSDRSNLRTELAQVAACALRWLAREVGGMERKEREERHIDLAKLRAAAEAGQDHLFNSALIFDLLAELERLYGIEVLHIVHSATVESVAEVLGPERLEAADGYQDAAVKALVAKVDRLTAERDALAAKLEEVTRERDEAIRIGMEGVESQTRELVRHIDERTRIMNERNAAQDQCLNLERDRDAAIARAERAERERDARPALTADEWRVVIRALRSFRSDYETSEPDEDIETASAIIGKLGKEGA